MRRIRDSNELLYGLLYGLLYDCYMAVIWLFCGFCMVIMHAQKPEPWPRSSDKGPGTRGQRLGGRCHAPRARPGKQESGAEGRNQC